MPTYEYQCESCGHRFEKRQRFSDPPVSQCEKCQGPVHKIFYPVGIVFKGSGWHITDYGKSGRNEQKKDEGEEKKDVKEKAEEVAGD